MQKFAIYLRRYSQYLKYEEKKREKKEKKSSRFASTIIKNLEK